MSGTPPAEAGRGWEALWRRDEVVADGWEEPDPRVVELGDRLRGDGVRRVYDLGCGVGRHTVALAERGMAVVATDVSPTALERCRAALARAGLGAELAQAAMDASPLATGSADWVIAYHVLYHATADGMERALEDVRRVLRSGGWLFATFISADDDKHAWFRTQVAAGRAEEMEPFTYRVPDDRNGDEFLPHHFSTETELRERFLRGFELVEVGVDRRSGPDRQGYLRNRAHWRVLARRR